MRAKIKTAQWWTVISWCTYPIVYLFPMLQVGEAAAVVLIQVGDAAAVVLIQVVEAAAGVLIVGEALAAPAKKLGAEGGVETQVEVQEVEEAGVVGHR